MFEQIMALLIVVVLYGHLLLSWKRSLKKRETLKREALSILHSPNVSNEAKKTVYVAFSASGSHRTPFRLMMSVLRIYMSGMRFVKVDAATRERNPNDEVELHVKPFVAKALNVISTQSPVQMWILKRMIRLLCKGESFKSSLFFETLVGNIHKPA